jgi:CDP-diacylglycerol--serine O-phosphatidyltransferase
VFAICCGLRLARFNVMIDDPNRPVWAGNYFTGVPAPAGAIIVLLPIYLVFLGLPKGSVVAPLTFVYTLTIAFLMVSRLPVFSGKKLGTRVPPDQVLIVFVVVVLFFALLLSYPWEVLSIGTIIYLACLPFGWRSYKEYERKDAEAAAQAPPAESETTAPPASSGDGPLATPPGAPTERPTHLN